MISPWNGRTHFKNEIIPPLGPKKLRFRTWPLNTPRNFVKKNEITPPLGPKKLWFRKWPFNTLRNFVDIFMCKGHPKVRIFPK
jgi:hypothetical protein